MTDQHPITPPPQLVEQWYDAIDNSSTSWKQELATQAARWGADQELDACCEFLEARHASFVSRDLHAARRPKPKSLAEEALEELSGIRTAFKAAWGGDLVDDHIRRALERLQELELHDSQV